MEGGFMKTLLVILAVLCVLPAWAETYTDTEFIVGGQPTATCPQPSGTTVVTTTGTVPVVQPGTTIVTSTVPPGEKPIYEGMTKQHVMEVMGHPTDIQKFRKFQERQQGIYDEVWTYQQPTGVIYVYIKERRVQKVEYR